MKNSSERAFVFQLLYVWVGLHMCNAEQGGNILLSVCTLYNIMVYNFKNICAFAHIEIINDNNHEK